MSNHANRIERAAIGIYSEFIRHASGTLTFVRDSKGNIIKDVRGRAVVETNEQAVMRRWNGLPELRREEFRREAEAALRMAA